MKLFKNLGDKPWANTAIAACIAILFYVIITHLGLFGHALVVIYGWIKPIVLGAIIAYILSPIAEMFENRVFKMVKKPGLRRSLGAAGAIILILLIIAILMSLLIPQLVDSISTFVSNMGSYSASLQSFLQNMENSLPGNAKLSDYVDKIYDALSSIPSILADNMSGIVDATANLGSNVVDVLLACIMAIYIMLDKDRLYGLLKKILRRWLPEERYSKLSGYWGKCNDIFIRFIAYDLLDGVIVGVVNCVIMLILGIPYSVLISVVVGVTNLAPTFGPIVGGIIGALILVLVNPWYALWFLIITVVLQTIDGYILKPKLFGGSLGVPAIWILITLTVGGRMFGVIGILLAIPFAAIMMSLSRELFPGLLDDYENGDGEG